MIPKSVLLCILFLTILISGTVFAKGPPDKVTIANDSFPESIEIIEATLLESLAMGHLVDFDRPITEPQSITTGYEIIRWYFVNKMGLKAIDKFTYYPDPKGGIGTIYYDGIIDKMFIYGGYQYDGKWFRVTESADLVIQELLADYDLLTGSRKFLQETLPDSFARGLPPISFLAVSSTVFYLALVYRKKVINTRQNQN